MIFCVSSPTVSNCLQLSPTLSNCFQPLPIVANRIQPLPLVYGESHLINLYLIKQNQLSKFYLPWISLGYKGTTRQSNLKLSRRATTLVINHEKIINFFKMHQL